MDIDEISDHISNNLNVYLTSEEQQQLILDNIGFIDNDEINSSMLKLSIALAAVNIHTAIEKALTSKDFVGDNPYSALSNPRAFIVYKYFHEQIGVKLGVN
jgi:hypothetical protein